MTSTAEDDPANSAADQHLRDRLGALAKDGPNRHKRIQRIELDGRVFWIKRPEKLATLRWRLQKGDPGRAFAAEMAGLRFLAEHGIPVPTLVHSAADHFVIADAGQPLHRLLATESVAEGVRAIVAAAQTLARLHHVGACHGRPKLRDICWDGQSARLIDLERFRKNAGAQAMGLDWVILLHSILETHPEAEAHFAAAVRSYRAEAPAKAVAAGTRLIRLLGIVRPALRLAHGLWPHNREIAAAMTLPKAFSSQ